MPNKSGWDKYAGTQKVRKVMHEYHEGELTTKSGKRVTSMKQAMAIAISESKRKKKK